MNFYYLQIMTHLPYTIIKSKAQYYKYCNILEALVDSKKKTKSIQDEIELLELLIEKYDAENSSFTNSDPVEIIKSLMTKHNMKAVDLAELLNVSEGLVSDMLKYKKGLSKETIRILSQKFKISQEAFNRPYKLKSLTQLKTTKRKPLKRATKIAKAF